MYAGAAAQIKAHAATTIRCMGSLLFHLLDSGRHSIQREHGRSGSVETPGDVESTIVGRGQPVACLVFTGGSHYATFYHCSILRQTLQYRIYLTTAAIGDAPPCRSRIRQTRRRSSCRPSSCRIHPPPSCRPSVTTSDFPLAVTWC